MYAIASESSIVALGPLSTLMLTGGTLAYLDPGTGSIILQVLVAFVFGTSLAIKIYWARIRAALRRILGTKRKSDR